MSNLAHKQDEPLTALDRAMKSLQEHGFRFLPREEVKRGQMLQNTQQLKRCEIGHEKVVVPMTQTVVCLDCDPYFKRECGVCTAPMWRCCC